MPFFSVKYCNFELKTLKLLKQNFSKSADHAACLNQLTAVFAKCSLIKEPWIFSSTFSSNSRKMKIGTKLRQSNLPR